MKKIPSRLPDPSDMYPGIYRVPFTLNRNENTRLRINTTSKPKMEITDQPDTITIELTIPGFRREDFIVTLKDHQLHIRALHFNHNILLPENIDPDFISAEYRNDKLILRFLKV